VKNPVVLGDIAREACLMTDEAPMYRKIGKPFAEHGHTLHGIKQYVHPTDRTSTRTPLKARSPASSAA